MLVFFFCCCCCCCCSGPQCLADKVASSRFKYLPNTCLPALTRLSLSDTQSDIMAVSDPVELSKQSYLAHKFYNYNSIRSYSLLESYKGPAKFCTSGKLLPSTLQNCSENLNHQQCTNWTQFRDGQQHGWNRTTEDQHEWAPCKNNCIDQP